MSISLIAVIISQCLFISHHHIALLKYIQFVFVSYASVKLRMGGGVIQQGFSFTQKSQGGWKESCLVMWGERVGIEDQRMFSLRPAYLFSE